MNTIKINILVNSLSFAALLIVAITGVVLWVFLPGSQGAGHSSLWGLDRHIWKDWHNWSGVVFIVLMLTHLILHRSWIKAMPQYLCKSKNNQ
ncbi:MAG: DUF4405 domain-containing protein [Candidatus Pacebacteria bacterium]|nr:DUF4405 domain-containing protein [Candidatus Paceibacterota bacterium]